MRFNGKVAVVTGAGSGIGRGIALSLAREGAFVVINDIRREPAEETLKIISGNGGSTKIAVSDVSTQDGAAAPIKAAIRDCGRLDLLVNNAGRQSYKAMDDLQPEEWDLILEVNLKACYLCAKSAVPFLAKQGGAIVNIASVHAQATIEGFAAYAASKAGILGLSRAMAVEYASRGIRVNAVSPGTIETPLLQAFFDSSPDPTRARSEFLKFHPIGRFGTPDDIGKVVAFLGSDDAGFITGAEVVVDGGMTACLLRQ
jgi:NAD(P)-dependent dehydrogenase (short-subunit alcohol dehydrogenase family)